MTETSWTGLFNASVIGLSSDRYVIVLPVDGVTVIKMSFTFEK